MASDLPNITLTGEDGAEVPKRTVKFQCGLLREQRPSSEKMSTYCVAKRSWITSVICLP